MRHSQALMLGAILVCCWNRSARSTSCCTRYGIEESSIPASRARVTSWSDNGHHSCGGEVRAHLDGDLLRRDRVAEETQPKKIAGTPLAATFCRVERICFEYSERRHAAEVDRLRRPLELHGKGDRCTLNDSLLQSVPSTCVLGTDQRDLIAIPLVNVVSELRTTRRVSRIFRTCVSVNDSSSIAVGSLLWGTTGLRSSERAAGASALDGRKNATGAMVAIALGKRSTYAFHPFLGIRQRLEVPHVEVQMLVAIRLTLTTREECEGFQLR